MRRLALTAIPVAIALTLLVIAGCGSEEAINATPLPAVAVPTAAAPAEVRDADLVLVWGAQGGARLEPCGCSAGMHGGLARRAAIIQRLPAASSLRLELGGWSGGGAQYQLLRARHYLRATRAVGIDVLGLGAAEVKLGSAALAQLADPRLVCANVAGLPTCLRLERGGHALLVTSVVAEGVSGPGLSASDPLPALHRLVAAAAGAAVVVMADLDVAGLEGLARAVPGLAVVVGGAVHDPSPVPLMVGSTRVMWAANAGKTVGWWPWGGAVCAFTLADDDAGDDPHVRAEIKAYQLAVGALGVADDPRFVGMTALGGETGHYLGDERCRACHVAPSAAHVASQHAHSLAVLTAKGYDQDPECLRCHVTGLGRSYGHDRALNRPLYNHVTCESCHGPRSEHVAARQAGRPGPELAPVTPATCVRCHDHENSPRFDYVTYWTRIHHG